MQYKKEEIRERIIGAALAEFEKNGYHKALIGRIAKNCNVPVGNIYRYFKSKEELFDAVVEDAYRNLPVVIEDVYQRKKGLNRNVKETAANIVESVMHIYNMYSRQLLILLDKSAGTKYADFTDRITCQIEKIIENALFRNAGENDLVISRIIAEGFVNGLFLILREKGGKAADGKLIERFLLFYFYKIDERI